MTSVTASYGDCSTPVRCRRPTRIEDARGNGTDYVWNAAHGGLESETRPAAPNGVRPQTRHSYSQSYAWYRTSASPTQVMAANPLWLRTRTSTCATASGSACTGTSGEVVTAVTYQSGSASTAANLLPINVSSGSGRGRPLAGDGGHGPLRLGRHAS